MQTIHRPSSTPYTPTTQPSSYPTKAERASQLISEAQGAFSSPFLNEQQKANIFIKLIELRSNPDMRGSLPSAIQENLRSTISDLNRDGAFTGLNLSGADLSRLY